MSEKCHQRKSQPLPITPHHTLCSLRRVVRIRFLTSLPPISGYKVATRTSIPAERGEELEPRADDFDFHPTKPAISPNQNSVGNWDDRRQVVEHESLQRLPMASQN
jgi:hypothetical protein